MTATSLTHAIFGEKPPLKSIALLGLIVLHACAPPETSYTEVPTPTLQKPYARYWWFASEITPEDVRYNLNWLKQNGFGGVELAWVYPLNRFNPDDTTYTPRQEWLSPEWTDIVRYTAQYADSIGLGCDFTLGTLWPFGDSRVTPEAASRRFTEPDWRQPLRLSWEHPTTGLVVDHLTPAHYLPYMQRVLAALPAASGRRDQACFIDSWEVETEYLWSESFAADFAGRFGYDIVPYMDSIYEVGFEGQRYDYMALLSQKVIQFYSDFDAEVNKAGYLSRGQVSGAPCDLLSGYATLDIPEGESMLFEPEFCRIPASAGALSGKEVVSCEAFTCLYGWPRNYMRREQAADVKLVADALLANGINQFIWHGKAHNPEGSDTVNFYATTHLGDSSLLATELPALNAYLSEASHYMRLGQPYHRAAVYLPTEDAWRAGYMPIDQQFKWAWGHYEMRYVYPPASLESYNPLWINGDFLQEAQPDQGQLRVGNVAFDFVYVDVAALDHRSLQRLATLSEAGARVVLRNTPIPPGHTVPETYQKDLNRLRQARGTSTDMPPSAKPVLKGVNLPPYQCREHDGALYVFLAHPASKGLKFPLTYGQSLVHSNIDIELECHYNGRDYTLKANFQPHQSLLYKLQDGNVTQLPLTYLPPTPTVESLPANHPKPWLVSGK